MPTTVTKTIKPSGGDYTSMIAAEAGEQRNLVTADEIAVFECYAMDDASASAQLDFSGWTVDATRYRIWRTPQAERHDGKWNTSKYRFRVTGGWAGFNEAVFIGGDYMEVDGIQISGEGNSTGNRTILGGTGTARNIHHNILKGNASGSGAFSGITNSCTPADSKTWNNVVYMESGTGITGIGLGSSNFDFNNYCYSNTVVGFPTSYLRSAGNNPVYKNNISQSASTAGYSGGASGSSVTNISEDATSPNAPLQNTVVTFVDEGNFDFHLSASDTSAKDAGTDLSADAVIPFSTDIDGATRSGTWDIGADEITDAAPRRWILRHAA